MKHAFLAAAIMAWAAFAGSTDKIGAPAPPFSARTLAGKEINLADYKGKVVLLDFWASWCGPCRKEMPFLTKLYQEYQDQGFEVVAVNIDDDKENAQAFLASLERKVPFPIAFDPQKRLPSLYQIEAMPTSVFIDKKGIVRYWHNGYEPSHQQRYRDELRTLLDRR